jgi:hypothetical protein
MTTLTISQFTARQRQLLRDLNDEHSAYQTALNQAQASLTRGMRIAEQNYLGDATSEPRNPVVISPAPGPGWQTNG